MNNEALKSIVRDVVDFPKKGIVFKDISPLFQNKEANQFIAQSLIEHAKNVKPSLVLGIESRGFIYGNTISLALDIPFVMARKKGKLPGKTIGAFYQLEYGVNELELHADSIKKGDRVLIHDDLLATGGTVNCVVKLIQQLGGEVIGFSFIVDLKFLKGNEKLSSISDNLFSIITYE